MFRKKETGFKKNLETVIPIMSPMYLASPFCSKLNFLNKPIIEGVIQESKSSEKNTLNVQFSYV